MQRLKNLTFWEITISIAQKYKINTINNRYMVINRILNYIHYGYMFICNTKFFMFFFFNSTFCLSSFIDAGMLLYIFRLKIMLATSKDHTHANLCRTCRIIKYFNICVSHAVQKMLLSVVLSVQYVTKQTIYSSHTATHFWSLYII